MEVMLLLVGVVVTLGAGQGQKCDSSVDLAITWTVNCSRRGLSSVPPAKAFHPVALLDLSHNSFQRLTESHFENWTDIAHLDLSCNHIEYIEAGSFKGLNNLVELNLMNNSLQVLSSNVTHHLPKLRILNVSWNKLAMIGAGAFDYVPSLIQLFLANNPDLGKHQENFKTLNFSLVKKLITLDMANISLHEINYTFFMDAQNLIFLNIAYNPLNRIPNLPFKLRSLNISGTLIDTIPQDLFTKSDVLQKLSMERMPRLKDVKPNALSGLSHLQDLYMNNCPTLEFISSDAFGESSPQLRKVDLSHCALTTLPRTFRPLLAEVQLLDLQHNPWACDGRISWIISVPIQPNLTENLRCENPPTSKGMLVSEFFRPRSLHHYSVLLRAGLVLALVVILVASVVGLLRHRRRRAETYRQLGDIRLQTRGSPDALPPL